MKKWISAILALLTAAALLSCAGCGGAQLTDADFKLYKADGTVSQEIETSEDGYIFDTSYDNKDEYTYRKIGIGNTFEEVKKAYADVWDQMKAYEIPNTDGQFIKYAGRDKIGTIDFQKGIVSSVYYRSEAFEERIKFSVFETFVFRYYVSKLNKNDIFDIEYQPIKQGWENSLNEKEKTLLAQFSEKHSQYFSENAMFDLDDITWLTDDEKETLKSMYQKFKDCSADDKIYKRIS